LHIAEAQRKVAQRYFDDGGYELACPPLRAILSILAKGEYEGKSIDAPEVRELFTLENLLASDWYQRRLVEQQARDAQHWTDSVSRLENYIDSLHEDAPMIGLDLQERLQYARERLSETQQAGYLESLVGTLGADPMRVAADDPIMIGRLASV